ncbi:hypothetical protein pb186bvf_013512 [Paramecium bursaria]
MVNVPEMVKLANITSAILLILIGVSQIVSLAILFKAFSFSFFMTIFLPFFLILFGALLLAAGFKMEFIDNNFKFLTSFIGRGMFNIYLASIAVYQLTNDTTEIVGFIIGGILFFTGCLYITFHFCHTEQLNAYRQQLE